MPQPVLGACGLKPLKSRAHAKPADRSPPWRLLTRQTEGEFPMAQNPARYANVSRPDENPGVARPLLRRSRARPLTILCGWLVLAAAVDAGGSAGIARLKLRTDATRWFHPPAPEVIYDQAIRDRFGIEDPIIVVVHSLDREGIFNPGSIQLVRDLTADFGKMPGIGPSSVLTWRPSELSPPTGHAVAPRSCWSRRSRRALNWTSCARTSARSSFTRDVRFDRPASRLPFLSGRQPARLACGLPEDSGGRCRAGRGEQVLGDGRAGGGGAAGHAYP